MSRGLQAEVHAIQAERDASDLVRTLPAMEEPLSCPPTPGGHPGAPGWRRIRAFERRHSSGTESSRGCRRHPESRHVGDDENSWSEKLGWARTSAESRGIQLHLSDRHSSNVLEKTGSSLSQQHGTRRNISETNERLHRRECSQSSTPRTGSLPRMGLFARKKTGQMPFLLLLLLSPPLAGGQDPPLNPTVELISPLTFQAKWSHPAAGQPSSGYQILVNKADRIFDAYFKTIPAASTSYIVNPTTALEFNGTNLLTDAPLAAKLQIQKGKLYTFHIIAVYGAFSSSEIQASPAPVMAIDRSGPPRTPYLCEYDESVGECAAESPGPRMIRMIWMRPLDSGGGDGINVAIEQYQVQLGKGGSFSGSNLQELNFTDPNGHQDTYGFEAFENLAAGDSYIGRVRALTAIGNGFWSELTTARTVVGVPGAPSAVAMRTGTATGPRVQMEWTIPSNTGDLLKTVVPLVNYFVALSPLSDFSGTQTVVVPVAPRTDTMTYTFTSQTDPFLTQGVRYYVRVYCSNALGNSAWSDVLNRILVGVPSAPRDASFSISGPLQMTTQWVAPQDVGAGNNQVYPLTSYQVALNTYPGVPVPTGFGTMLIDVLPDRTTHIIPALAQGTRYYLQVRARNDANDNDGYGPWSIEGVGVCTDGAARPSVCGNTFLIAIGLPSLPPGFLLRPFGSLVLKALWDRPTQTGDGSNSYPLMWYELFFQQLGFDAVTILPSDSELEYTSGSKEVGSVHTARIRAVNDAGTSEWSALSVHAEATALLLPNAPTGVAASVNAPFTITVTWVGSTQTGLGDAVWPLLSYQVLVVSECASVPDQSISVSAQALSLEVGDMVKGCVYTFSVRAENEAGYGEYGTSNSELALDLSTAPLNLAAVTDRSLQVSLSWDIPSDTGPARQDVAVLLPYVVRVYSDAQRTQPIREEQTTERAFNVLNLEKEVTVYITVLAVNKAGEGLPVFATATPIIPVLSDVTYTVSSMLAGSTINLDLGFVLATEINPDDHIAITFPTNFFVPIAFVSGVVTGFDGAFRVTTGANPCGYQCTPRAETVYLQLAGGTQVAIGTRIEFRLGGVVNRRWAGPAEIFQIRTLNSLQDFTINEALNVTGYALTAGPLSLVQATFQGSTTGEVNSVDLQFSSPRNPLPVDVRLAVEFGDLMLLSGASAVGVSPSLISGPLQVEVVGQTVNLRRTDTNGQIPAGTLIQLRMEGVRNRITAGPSGDLAVRAFTSFDGLMDESLGVAGITVRAGLITQATVNLETAVAFQSGYYRFLFSVADAGLPADSIVLVEFPEGVDVSNAAVNMAQSTGIDGQMRVEVSGRNASFVREGTRTETAPSTPIVVQVDGVRNYYVGDAVPFKLWTLLVGTGAGDGLMEYIPSIAGTATTAAKLDVLDFQLSSTLTGETGSLHASLRIGGMFNLNGNDGGVLVMEFPDGFEFVADPMPAIVVTSPTRGVFQLLGAGAPGCPMTNCPGLSKQACQSRSWMVCQVLTLELAGGNEWPAGTVFDLTFPNLVNSPLGGPTGPFSMRTLSSAGALSDENNEEQLHLTPNTIPVRFEPESELADAVTHYAIHIDAFNVVPPTCNFVAAFPASVTFPGAVSVSSTTPDIGALQVTLTSVDVQTTRSTSNPVNVIERSGNLTISRIGNLLPSGTTLVLRVGPVRHRETSGRAGEFALTTSTTDGVAIEQNLSNSRMYLVYDVPVAAGLDPTNAARTGGAALSLSGENFGPVQLNPLITGSDEQRSVVVGHTACVSTAWVSDTHLTCVVSGGFAPAVDVQLTIEQQSGSRMAIFTYDHHAVTEAGLVNFPVFTVWTVVHGSGFGGWDTTLGARVGFTATESTEWTADSHVRCMISSGERPVMAITVSVVELLSTTTEVFTHDTPKIGRIDITDAPVPTARVDGVGFGLGSTARARLGSTSCERSEWMSESSLSGMTTRQIVSSQSATITASTMFGSLSEAVSYAQELNVSLSQMSNLPDENGPMLAILASSTLPQHSPTARVGDTACERSEWISDSALHCAPSIGVGGSMHVVVTAGLLVGSQFESASYDRAAVARFEGNGNVASNGEGIEIILGVGFGAEASSLAGRAGQSECAQTAWISDSGIQCRFESIAGGSHRVVVTVGEEVASASNALSYDAPALVEGILHPDGMAIHGDAFGHFDVSPYARAGATSCEMTTWISLTGLSCLMARGLGNTNPLALTVLDQVGTVTEAWSMGTTDSLAEHAMNFHAKGTFEVVSVSSGFFSLDSSAAVRSSTACEHSSWVSDSLVLCKSANSFGGSLVTTVTVGVVAASVQESISFDPAHGLQLRGMTNHARDSNPISLSGQNFGDHDLTQRARLGSSVMEAAHWLSETSLTCHPAHGTAGTTSLIVTAGVQVTSLTEALSFDTLTLFGMEHKNSVHGASHETTISGMGFGEHGISQRARFSATECESTNWHSSTAIGTVLSSEVLRTSSISLTVGTRIASTSDSFSFDANDMHIIQGSHNGPFASLALQLVGSGLATSDFTFQGRAASSACEVSTWQSETGLVCKVAWGQGGTHRVIVTSSGVGDTLSEAWSYDHSEFAHALESATFANAAHSGGMEFTLFGADFGIVSATQWASTGFSASEMTNWLSETSLACTLARGSGWATEQRFVVTSSEADGSLSEAFTLDFPQLSSTTPVSASLNFGANTTVTGVLFAAVDLSGAIRIGGSATENTKWISESSLHCRISGTAASQRASLVHTVGVRAGSISEAFSYADAHVNRFRPHNAPKSGDDFISLVGINFGTFSVTEFIRIGDTHCHPSFWTSDTFIMCRVSPSDTPKTDIFVQILEQNISFLESVTFDAPVMSSNMSANIPALEGMDFTITGLEFGVFSGSARFRFAETAAESSGWISDSSLHALSGRGAGSTLSGFVTIAVAIGTASEVLSFDSPEVHPITLRHVQDGGVGGPERVDNQPTRAGSLIDLSGQHLGVYDATGRLRTGMTSCEASFWMSDSMIMARYAVGSGASLAMSVTVAELAHTTSEVFSFDVGALMNNSVVNVPRPGFDVLSVGGVGLGLMTSSLGMRIGYSTCQRSEWISDTAILCRIRTGFQSSWNSAVTINTQVTTVTGTLSYDAPLITSTGSDRNGPQSEFSELIIEPRGGDQKFSLATRMGGTAAELTLWLSSSTLYVKTRFAMRPSTITDVVMSVGTMVGSLSQAHVYDRHTLSHASPPNGPTNPIAPITLNGQGFGSGVQSASARLSYSSCLETRWKSDTALQCVATDGFVDGGNAVTLTIQMDVSGTMSHAFTYDGPRLTDIAETVGAESSPQLLEVYGHNFGVSDPSLNARIGAVGCAQTTWQSDTSLFCRLRGSSTASDISLTDVRGARICRKCPSTQVLVDCTVRNAGHCIDCQTCDVGFFRDGCQPGTDQSGSCTACPNAGLDEDQRTFKSIVGFANTTCSQCTVCGGVNHDGSFYETGRCTETQDTVCTPCESCPVGVRIGCARTVPGTCVEIDAGVSSLVSTSSVPLEASQLTGLRYYTVRTTQVFLTGRYAGYGVSIPAEVSVTLGSANTQIAVAITQPTSAMLLSASRDFAYPYVIVTYFHPSKTVFVPPVAKIEMAFNDTGTEPHRIAIFLWNATTPIWQEKLGTSITSTGPNTGSASVETGSFSRYAVLRVPTPTSTRTSSTTPSPTIAISSTTASITTSPVPNTTSSSPNTTSSSPNTTSSSPNTTSSSPNTTSSSPNTTSSSPTTATSGQTTSISSQTTSTLATASVVTSVGADFTTTPVPTSTPNPDGGNSSGGGGTGDGGTGGDGDRDITPDPDGQDDDNDTQLWERLEVLIPIVLFAALVLCCLVGLYAYKCMGVAASPDPEHAVELTQRPEDAKAAGAAVQWQSVDATLMQSPIPPQRFGSPGPAPPHDRLLYGSAPAIPGPNSPPHALALPPRKSEELVARASPTRGRSKTPPKQRPGFTPLRPNPSLSQSLDRANQSMDGSTQILERPASRPANQSLEQSKLRFEISPPRDRPKSPRPSKALDRHPTNQSLDVSPRRPMNPDKPQFPMTPPHLQPRPPPQSSVSSVPPNGYMPGPFVPGEPMLPTVTPGERMPSTITPGQPLMPRNPGSSVFVSPIQSSAQQHPQRASSSRDGGRWQPPPPPYPPPFQDQTLTPYTTVGYADQTQTPGTAAVAKRVAFTQSGGGGTGAADPRTYASRFASPTKDRPLPSTLKPPALSTAYIAPPNVQALSPDAPVRASPAMRDERGNTIRGTGASTSLETTLAMLAMGFSTPMRVSGDFADEINRGQQSPVNVFASRERERNPGHRTPPVLPVGARGGLQYDQPRDWEPDEDGRDDDSNVDDVILSIAHDYSGRRSNVSDREDTPERFGARVQHDVEAEEAEFSIQPGARRFVPSPRSPDDRDFSARPTWREEQERSRGRDDRREPDRGEYYDGDRNYPSRREDPWGRGEEASYRGGRRGLFGSTRGDGRAGDGRAGSEEMGLSGSRRAGDEGRGRGEREESSLYGSSLGRERTDWRRDQDWR